MHRLIRVLTRRRLAAVLAIPALTVGMSYALAAAPAMAAPHQHHHASASLTPSALTGTMAYHRAVPLVANNNPCYYITLSGTNFLYNWNYPGQGKVILNSVNSECYTFDGSPGNGWALMRANGGSECAKNVYPHATTPLVYAEPCNPSDCLEWVNQLPDGNAWDLIIGGCGTGTVRAGVGCDCNNAELGPFRDYKWCLLPLTGTQCVVAAPIQARQRGLP